MYHNLNENQEVINNYYEFQIEHILPKVYIFDGGWSEIDHKDNVNKLGNLTLLEETLNKKAKNQFFEKKKEFYKLSKIYDVKVGLCKLKKWTIKECNERFDDIKERLVNFLFKI